MNKIVEATTLAPGGHTDFDGPKTIKVQNDSPNQSGKFQVKCPNVNPVTYDLEQGDKKYIQIPVGTSTFTNTGRTYLTLSVFAAASMSEDEVETSGT